MSTRYLDLTELLTVVDRIVGRATVRDYGLLQSSLARPATDVFGQEAYPTPHDKAGALLHSLARNHALLDGNKRTAWTACRVMLAMNDTSLNLPPTEEVVQFVESVARGDIDVGEVAARLRSWTT